eukprot:Clim_evm29s206 gene=Clim_evmTU29s206
MAAVPISFGNGAANGSVANGEATNGTVERLPHGYDYDLIVIGGGSGGLAAGKKAADLGAKVALLDFVTPTPQGTSWGLGGTCVNVGCIPKKLMHQASLLGELAKEDAPRFGWKFADQEKISHSWEDMVQNVQDHIMSLNWGYRVALRTRKIEYMNAYGSFIDAHTVHAKFRRKEQTITADKILIAVGGRPTYPDIPGATEYGISSDDLFSLVESPGKTVVVGASYVALECAGFLAGLGLDVTVIMRSIPLRGFDQQIAEQITAYMIEHGVKFLRGYVPTEVQSHGEKDLEVFYKETNAGADAMADSIKCNTVLFAIGRKADTDKLGLEKAGVEYTAKSGKIAVDSEERTNVDNIYAIGDVIVGQLELTPVAIKAGRLLVQRLFGKSKKRMNYGHVPTTVFTPIEYGCVGLAEEDAIAKYGEDNIEVYHTYFKPLEYTVPKKPDNQCYMKVITLLPENERIVGMHFLGPNAGEVIQGFGMTLILGGTKEHLDDLVGIHPTNAEWFTTMELTKRSGADISVTGC